ncbi:Protein DETOXIFICATION 18 [Dichanthelium oligosanthes]|uniref:Protein DETOXIFICATION n=1 Tax=Dichanthelium oligosanthes TaxID=888268 RepID=A0A1E5UPT0_9POAL|nr:Protein DETOXIFICATION 18 [Dichanthelium oligosanthes]
MGEEAAAPLLGDVHLNLNLHGDADGNDRKEVELPAAPTNRTDDSRRWMLGWDWAEVAGQLTFAAPMVATSMAYYAIPLVSVMYAGRLGDIQLAAATLGNSWGTVTGIALMVIITSIIYSSIMMGPTGLSGALETLCGQGYGAKAYRMMGVYLQASMVTSALFSVLVSLLWLYSEPVLVFLRQDPEVSRLAAVFLRYMIPAQFAYGFIQCTLRFLQTQSVVMPLVAFSLLPLAIHVGITHAFVNYLGLGFAGAAMATSVSLWLSFLMLAAYVRFSDMFKDTWGGFTTEALRHVLPGMKLAIPSAVMVCFEYWSIEILVLLAGLMPESQLSTSVIAMCANTEAISYMITYGFAAVISTRVSNELGARNIANAKKALTVSLALSLMLAVAFLLLLGLGHEVWVRLFSNSEAVVSAFASMTPLLIGSVVLDSTQGVLSGVARGCGWQHLAAWTNLVAFYIIGLPLAVLFAFTLGFQTKGLWMGQICGLFCQNCVLLFITLRTDWEKLDLTMINKENDFVC